MNEDNKRLKYIDAIKGFSVICVVIIHIIGIDKGITLLLFTHRFAIPVFVFITGFLAALYIDKSYIEILSKRLNKMYKLYFIYMCLTYLLIFKSIPLEEIFLHIISGTINENYNLALWYAPFYISLCIVFFAIIKFSQTLSNIYGKLFENKEAFYYIIIFIFSIILSMIGMKITIVKNYYYIKHTLIMIPFATFGYLIKKICDYSFDIINKNKDTFNDRVLAKTKIENCGNNHTGDPYNKFIRDTYNIKIFIIKLLLLLIIFVVFIKSTFASGYIDIFYLRFQNIMLFYISTLSATLFLFLFFYILEPFIKHIFIYGILSHLGKESIHICFLHLLLYPLIGTIVNNFSFISELINNNQSIEKYIYVAILLFISFICSQIFN